MYSNGEQTFFTGSFQYALRKYFREHVREKRNDVYVHNRISLPSREECFGVSLCRNAVSQKPCPNPFACPNAYEKAKKRLLLLSD